MKFDWKNLLITLIATQALGYLWYGPLNGESWMDLKGLTQRQVEAAGWTPMFIAWFAAVAVWWVLSALLRAVRVGGAKDGAIWGMQLGVAFGFLPTWMNHSFGQEPLQLTLILGGYMVLWFMLTGAIVGAGIKRAGA